MLTRRGFAGFASCAICAVTGFVAEDASAQNKVDRTTLGIKRTVLSTNDGPVPGYVTIVIVAEIEAGATVPRHTHPGIESGYILDGELDFLMADEPPRAMKTGDSYYVARGVPHNSTIGDKTTKFLSTYVVEKGKPFASPA